MKKGKGISIVVCLLVVLFLVNTANADLVDNGDGTITDIDRNLMWLQDANYAMTSGYKADGLMTGFDALTWADNLVFGGYSNWRLPSALNYNGTICGPALHCIESEMGHLYYVELLNIGSPVLRQNDGPFINIQNAYYWSGTRLPDAGDNLIMFDFTSGFQTNSGMGSPYNAWAVRDCGGTCPPPPVVPEPISSTLFVIGAGLLAGRRYLRKKK